METRARSRTFVDVPGRVRVRVGCEFVFDSPSPVAAVAMLRPKREDDRMRSDERWATEPELRVRDGVDALGNEIRRFVVPVGRSSLRYEAVVVAPDAPDPTDLAAPQCDPGALPDETLVYLLPSRYCPSDRLGDEAWRLFGQLAPGWARVQAISDWVHGNIAFAYGASSPSTDAAETYERRSGVCRDFAQLAIAFCRALNVPARYAFGYLPDIGVAPPDAPMDFCAWTEVFLGSRWWTFDPRNNERRIAHLVVGRGRDAADVPMIMTFGQTTLERMTVWADRIP